MGCSTEASISGEAYTNPEIVKTAPHNAALHAINRDVLDDPERWAMTWSAYLKKANNNERRTEEESSGP